MVASVAQLGCYKLLAIIFVLVRRCAPVAYCACRMRCVCAPLFVLCAYVYPALLRATLYILVGWDGPASYIAVSERYNWVP